MFFVASTLTEVDRQLTQDVHYSPLRVLLSNQHRQITAVRPMRDDVISTNEQDRITAQLLQDLSLGDYIERVGQVDTCQHMPQSYCVIWSFYMVSWIHSRSAA